MQGECRATMGECFGDAKILILATHSRVKICPCDGGIRHDGGEPIGPVWQQVDHGQSYYHHLIKNTTL